MLNVFDIGIILLLIMFVIIGFKKGVIKELVSLVGIIIVFVLSWCLKGIIGDFLCTFMPFFKFSGVISGMSTINILMYQVIAFLIVFSLLLGVYAFSLKLSRIVQKIVNLTIILWIPSKILGAVVSLIKGYLILFVCFIFLMIPLGGYSIFNESTMVNVLLYKTPFLSNYVSSFVEPVDEIFSLGDDVVNKKITVNGANLKAVDIMLKYNVTTKDTINRLVSLKKLDNIDGVDVILKKY